jgi:hypothetical protein
MHRLISTYRGGVKWDSSDHLCVVGELLPAEPVDEGWAIKGEVLDLPSLADVDKRRRRSRSGRARVGPRVVATPDPKRQGPQLSGET